MQGDIERGSWQATAIESFATTQGSGELGKVDDNNQFNNSVHELLTRSARAVPNYHNPYLQDD